MCPKKRSSLATKHNHFTIKVIGWKLKAINKTKFPQNTKFDFDSELIVICDEKNKFNIKKTTLIDKKWREKNENKKLIKIKFQRNDNSVKNNAIILD